MPSPPRPAVPAGSAVDPRSIRIAPLTLDHAMDIATWRYHPPYDLYDMTGIDPQAVLKPEVGWHGVLAGDRLIGFRSYGTDGQVPGWAYDDGALDTGGGLRPELTGQGLGRTVLSAALAHGREVFAPPAFRVTVAAFNVRAQRTVRNAGFEPVGSFHATHDRREFLVLTRS